MTLHVLPLPLSLPLPGGTSLSTPIRPRMRPLSLAARWDLPVSADRPFALSTSLVRGPRMSATAPFPNLPPALYFVDAPTIEHFPATSPRPSPFLESAPTHSPRPVMPQPNSLALFLALCTHPSSSAMICHDHSSFCGRRRASGAFDASVSSASLSATRNVPQFALFPSGSLCSCSPKLSPCNRRTATVNLGPRRVPVAIQGPQSLLSR
jgi:hypothetical protein